MGEEEERKKRRKRRREQTRKTKRRRSRQTGGQYTQIIATIVQLNCLFSVLFVRVCVRVHSGTSSSSSRRRETVFDGLFLLFAMIFVSDEGDD